MSIVFFTFEVCQIAKAYRANVAGAYQALHIELAKRSEIRAKRFNAK